MQFKAFEPGIEVSGESVGAIVDGFRKFPTIAQKYLSKYGFIQPTQKVSDLDRSRWYPQESWLLAFEAIANEIGVNSLYGMGRMIPENSTFPPHLHDVPSALGSLDIAYHMNHRKNGKIMFNPETGEMLEGIGHLIATPVANEQRMIVVCGDPYTCDFSRGIIGGLANRFDPGARCSHDNASPCRKQGADSCTYMVWW
jgi:hypothetical protein